MSFPNPGGPWPGVFLLFPVYWSTNRSHAHPSRAEIFFGHRHESPCFSFWAWWPFQKNTLFQKDTHLFCRTKFDGKLLQLTKKIKTRIKRHSDIDRKLILRVDPPIVLNTLNSMPSRLVFSLQRCNCTQCAKANVSRKQIPWGYIIHKYQYQRPADWRKRFKRKYLFCEINRFYRVESTLWVHRWREAGNVSTMKYAVYFLQENMSLLCALWFQCKSRVPFNPTLVWGIENSSQKWHFNPKDLLIFLSPTHHYMAWLSFSNHTVSFLAHCCSYLCQDRPLH